MFFFSKKKKYYQCELNFHISRKSRIAIQKITYYEHYYNKNFLQEPDAF